MIVLFLVAWPQLAVAAPGDVEACSAPFNISNSEGYVSVDPFLLADPAGRVHLFWAERKSGQPDAVPNVPDSLMYTAWDGEVWSEPVDIFISPPEMWNQRIAGIRGVMDNSGNIHLVWMGPDNQFYYSSAPADTAGSANAWHSPFLLADDQVGTQYSVDIAYAPPQTLHVVYGRSLDEDFNSLSYARSEDAGMTWSEPVDIYVAYDLGRGVSNVRMYVDGDDKLYATWTEWDESGNGQAIYFVRSLDGGHTWDRPVVLDEREGDEYERDWVNLAVLGEDHLVVFWEGGFRAYPQAQYSYDGGSTWSDPIDTLYWLIADNGFAEFVRDGSGRLHILIARRIREGFESRCDRFPGCEETENGTNTIWHTTWEGGTGWREPQPFGSFNDSNFVSAVVTGGNQIIAAHFNYTDLEVAVTQCKIADASSVAPQPWPTPTPKPLPTSTPTLSPTSLPTATPTRTLLAVDPIYPPASSTNSGMVIVYSVIPALLSVLAVLILRRWRHS